MRLKFYLRRLLRPKIHATRLVSTDSRNFWSSCFSCCLFRLFGQTVKCSTSSGQGAVKSYLLDLPVETISNILDIGNQDHVGHSPFGATVSGVCRYLRTIVLHLPKLWSKISYTSHDPSDDQERLRAFTALLARSNNLLISVHLEIIRPTHSKFYPSSCAPSNVIPIIVRHLPHCHSLVAHLSEENDWAALAHGRAPALMNFSMHTPLRRREGYTLPSNWNNFAPKLKHLTVDGLWPTWKTIIYPSLVELNIMNVPGQYNMIYALMMALNKAFRLKTLSLSFKELAGPFDHTRVIHLPKLAELSISGENSDVGFVLSVLMAPVLSHLRLHSVSLLRHGSRTFPSITHLEAWDLKHASEISNWTVLHQSMPSLAHVHANGPFHDLLQEASTPLCLHNTRLPKDAWKLEGK